MSIKNLNNHDVIAMSEAKWQSPKLEGDCHCFGTGPPNAVNLRIFPSHPQPQKGRSNAQSQCALGPFRDFKGAGGLKLTALTGPPERSDSLVPRPAWMAHRNDVFVYENIWLTEY